MRACNFFVSGAKFTEFFSLHVEGVVVDHVIT